MAWPKPNILQNFHYECNQGIYFDELIRSEKSSLLFSANITDSYYNFLAAEANTEIDDIFAAQREFEQRSRQLAVYVRSDLEEISSAVSAAGLERAGTDSWLGIEPILNAPEATPDESVLLTYIDGNNREGYISAFSNAYSGDAESDDPYGDLEPGYVESLRKSFDHKVPSFEVRYLQATHENSVVGVAMMIIRENMAGIYGLGVVKGTRHHGIGKAMMDKLAHDAAENRVEFLFLQTEAGSAVERWYRSFGYGHLFNAAYYALPESRTA